MSVLVVHVLHRGVVSPSAIPGAFQRQESVHSLFSPFTAILRHYPSELLLAIWLSNQSLFSLFSQSQ